MSLYAFGKIVSPDEVSTLSQLDAIGRETSTVFREGVDPGDLELMLTEAPQLRGPGVAFSLVSGPDQSDATALWVEAMAATRPSGGATKGAAAAGEVCGAFLATRLGQACRGVFGLGGVSAVALVDGGIERVFSGTADGCLGQIGEDIRVPWDQSPNRLYVCIHRPLAARPPNPRVQW